MKTTIENILKNKGNQTYSVAPNDSVFEAVKKMADHEIGAVIVLVGNELVGILSERDCARKIILSDKKSTDTSVKDVMTKEVYCAIGSSTVQECLEIMNKKKFRHLPITEDGQVIGMISIKDLVNKIIEDQQSTIDYLETYIKRG